MNNKNVLIPVVTGIIVGALAFAGGMKYQQIKVPSQIGFGNRQFQSGNRQPGQNGQNRAFRPTVGEIIGIDDKSITIKMADGSTKIVIVPESATISKTDTGVKTDLKTGVTVGIFGTDNSDGSVTAQNIQLNPMFRMGNAISSPTTNR